MAAASSVRIKTNPIKPVFNLQPTSQRSQKPNRIRFASPTATGGSSGPSKHYFITLLPGDGIDPNVINVAKNALELVGSLEGLENQLESDAVLLGAIGGYKWDKNKKHLKPEMGLLQLRAGLKVFANLRPATVLPQLVDASTLKKDVAEGVDVMVVRELAGGIYFGKPRGLGTNDDGEEIGFNTEVYAASEVDHIACVAFETARKRNGKLCSVDKANALEKLVGCKEMGEEISRVQNSHYCLK